MNDKPLVLAVDDSVQNLDMLEEILKRDFRLALVESGEAALAWSLSNPVPDCVLLDIMMSGIDGYEVCKQLHANAMYQDVPIMFISALDETPDKLKGFEVGGVDYVTKPFEPRELLARVRTHVRLRAVQREYLAAKLHADQAVSAKNHFLACVSHEFRTPLQVILGTADLFVSKALGSLTPEQTRFIERIEESGRHLLSLVNDVLDITQIDADALSLDAEPFPISDLIPPVIGMMDSHFLHKRLKVTTDLPEGLPSIQGDLRKCRQVLLNLLSNAVKYTPEEGSITVSAKAMDDGTVVIEVQDTGAGIPSEACAKLFSDYYQVDRLRDTSLGGKGLGLALSRRLVQLHGGCMGVESSEGNGARFWFSLPTAQAGQAVAPVPAPAEAPISLQQLQGGSVLVVEDDLLAANTLSDMMTTVGMSVSVARNAEEACRFYSSQHFDVILTDLYMSGVSGPAVVQMLRTQLGSKEAPILVTTSHTDRETIRMCRAKGAREFLVKPIRRECLLPRLAVLLAEQAEANRAKV